MDDKPDWNNITKHPLFLIGAAAAIVIAFYYIASPYENCFRAAADNVFARIDCERRNFSW